MVTIGKRGNDVLLSFTIFREVDVPVAIIVSEGRVDSTCVSDTRATDFEASANAILKTHIEKVQYDIGDHPIPRSLEFAVTQQLLTVLVTTKTLISQPRLSRMIVASAPIVVDCVISTVPASDMLSERTFIVNRSYSRLATPLNDLTISPWQASPNYRHLRPYRRFGDFAPVPEMRFRLGQLERANMSSIHVSGGAEVKDEYASANDRALLSGPIEREYNINPDALTLTWQDEAARGERDVLLLVAGALFGFVPVPLYEAFRPRS